MSPDRSQAVAVPSPSTGTPSAGATGSDRNRADLPRSSNGGGCPALLLRGRSARFLSGPIAPALGVPLDGDGTATAWLRPGDILVLYSDGLIEHPGLDMEIGLRRLADTARRLAAAPLEDLCAELVGLGFDGPQPADDLTALVFGVEDHTRQGGPQC